MKKINKCDCNNERPILCNGGDHFWIKCFVCKKQTQIYKTKLETIDAWNNKETI